MPTAICGNQLALAVVVVASSLNWLGEPPLNLAKQRLNCDNDWNPTIKAISDIRALGLRSSVFAQRIRV